MKLASLVATCSAYPASYLIQGNRNGNLLHFSNHKIRIVSKTHAITCTSYEKFKQNSLNSDICVDRKDLLNILPNDPCLNNFNDNSIMLINQSKFGWSCLLVACTFNLISLVVCTKNTNEAIIDYAKISTI